ncbi:MAG: hypothetical protein HKN29_04045 [Rhodothermales bacterium]|nr:hypothetical protein [Rhodothermales bacterium]
MILRYHMQVSPRLRSRSVAALETLCDGLGVRAVSTRSGASAELIYSASRPARMLESAIWIRHDPQTEIGPEQLGANMDRALREIASLSRGSQAILEDLLQLVWSLASGEAERTLPRNAFGVPMLAGPEAAFLRRPLISEAVEGLARALAVRHPSFEGRIKRWPGGAQAAFMLTHDVDAPYRRPRGAFYRNRMVRDLKNGNVRQALHALAGWTRIRIKDGRSLPAAEDPNFGFEFWRQVEEGLGGRGCFYVAVRSADEPGAHPADVPYHAADPEMVAAMRALTRAGWEIGLHASIHAARDPGRFAREKEQLEALLDGAPVRGVRHHYWALNGERPRETWRAQKAAGFAYDSSLGTNDAPGFRRGVAWPVFTGPDCVLQVPPTLMDGAIFYEQPTPEEGESAIRTHLQQVFALGGAANLDWHLEQSNAGRLSGAGPALLRALSAVRGRSDIWVTTPGDMAAWWEVRRQRRLAIGTVRERIVASPSRKAVRPPVSPRVSPFSREASRSESSTRP